MKTSNKILLIATGILCILIVIIVIVFRLMAGVSISREQIQGKHFTGASVTHSVNIYTH